jgi:hypothetical protein
MLVGVFAAKKVVQRLLVLSVMALLRILMFCLVVVGGVGTPHTELKCVVNEKVSLSHEDIWRTGCIHPYFLDLGPSWV